jgi:histidyl-tRNA synthetase
MIAPRPGVTASFTNLGWRYSAPKGLRPMPRLLLFATAFSGRLQIKGLSIELNSVGCPVCRPGYREVLLPHLEKIQSELCGDCRRRYQTNPMRVLDCKEEGCRELVQTAPRMVDHLCPDCDKHFKDLKSYLDKLQVPYNLNTSLVRGLDYYTRTAFEITAGGVGAQSSICGGGRYDHLVEHIGGPPTPGVGVAFGKERVLMAMELSEAEFFEESPLFVATAGEGLEAEALLLAGQLRSRLVAAETDLLSRSLKAQMKYAGRRGFDQVVIIGESEIEKGLVSLRDMEDGDQKELSRDDFLSISQRQQ